MNREEALRALVEEWAGQDGPTGYGPDFDAGRDSALYRCRNQLRAILDASPWIPVAERLPECRHGSKLDLLVTMRHPRGGEPWAASATWEESWDEWTFVVNGSIEYPAPGGYVTHWQLLPEPYREEP